MNSRSSAIKQIVQRKIDCNQEYRKPSIDKFGHFAFSQNIMERMLPKEVCANILKAMKGREKINPDYADSIAQAMKDWACGLGATHFCHWFQPLTGFSAQKHEAFYDWKSPDNLIEKFSGKQLLQGEPDGSSFPTGGLRSTAEARGYTAWDPSSSPFLRRFGGCTVLTIPSVFFSWTGEALDAKIPLLRSDAKICDAVMRLMNMNRTNVSFVYSTLGCEQEYFVVDRALFMLRPDLVMAGRTVFGLLPAKNQQLQDQYFGLMKERVLAFMKEFEENAFDLGIPLKTRHNEVAPGQFEVAPLYEKCSVAVDHNMLLMEIMQQTAIRHQLSCLLHEKPFAGINGSGKHNNWSLSTDSGVNLLNPSENPFVFLVLVTAILHAVYEHAGLLRAAIASASNDHRLGGHEAPPVIISVFLGGYLEKILTEIEETDIFNFSFSEKIDLKIQSLPEFFKDPSDRNRTSPISFTGSKFEFRSVGSSANCSFSQTVINLMMAQSLHAILDEVESSVDKPGNMSGQELQQAFLPVLRKYLKISRPIRFSGDNYSSQWQEEAKQRGLPSIEHSFEAFEILSEQKTLKLFEGVLSENELQSHSLVLHKRYALEIDIESKIMIDLFRTQILPVALEYQNHLACSVKSMTELNPDSGQIQLGCLKKLVDSINESILKIDRLEAIRQKAENYFGYEGSKFFCTHVIPCLQHARICMDQLEELIDDRLWPLPKYRELLWIL